MPANLKELFLEKLRDLPMSVYMYTQLKKNITNPVLLTNQDNEQKLETILFQIKNGESLLMDSLEQAVLMDLLSDIMNQEKDEKVEPEKTGKFLKRKVTCIKMLDKYINLIQMILTSNIHYICYAAMIISFIIKPGIFTMIYPVTVFGYALLLDPRPPRAYWYVIMCYTQALIIAEFLLSLNFQTSWGRAHNLSQ